MKKIFIISAFLSLGVFLLLLPLFLQLTSYLHPIALVVVFFCLFFLVFLLILIIRKKTIDLPYSLFKWVLILYTTALMVLLFFRPNDQSYDSLNLIPFATIRYYLSGEINWIIAFYNLAANIGLFIPYGIYLMTKNPSFIKLLFTPFIFISLIETLQFITHRGSLDIDDLVLNMLGFAIGYLFYPIFKKVFIVH